MSKADGGGRRPCLPAPQAGAIWAAVRCRLGHRLQIVPAPGPVRAYPASNTTHARPFRRGTGPARPRRSRRAAPAVHRAPRGAPTRTREACRAGSWCNLPRGFVEEQPARFGHTATALKEHLAVVPGHTGGAGRIVPVTGHAGAGLTLLRTGRGWGVRRTGARGP